MKKSLTVTSPTTRVIAPDYVSAHTLPRWDPVFHALTMLFSNAEIVQLFLHRNPHSPRLTTWQQYGFKKYDSNSEKIIIEHESVPGYIMKLVDPTYIDRDVSVWLNMSRVVMASKIRKAAKKYVLVPKKYFYYCDPIQQHIVLAEKIENLDISNNVQQLLQLGFEPLKELFAVCKEASFYDLSPRNLYITPDLRIMIIDTEDFR
eukprot:GEZU01014997.1.p1 GENE.GEZU01014997.1~~GEZU01014997.1.p1  ORF type:complete len:211 (-),score=60.32 GEZU01014997.1:32-643(-)